MTSFSYTTHCPGPRKGWQRTRHSKRLARLARFAPLVFQISECDFARALLSKPPTPLQLFGKLIAYVQFTHSGVKHLEEIKEAGYEHPAVNQIEVKPSNWALRGPEQLNGRVSCIPSASRSRSWNIARSSLSSCRPIARSYGEVWTTRRSKLWPRRQASFYLPRGMLEFLLIWNPDAISYCSAWSRPCTHSAQVVAPARVRVVIMLQ